MAWSLLRGIEVDSGKEFDAARAYLKELDVTNFVWTGLKRAKSNVPFLWPETKEMSDPEGRWAVEVPKTEEPMCAATDPSADYRWQPLPCSGPTVAAFICQMNVPSWAQNEKGCMLTSLPSLTVTFLPEQGAVELISDCGSEGIRRISCKGQANRDEMIRQLACESTATETTQPELTEESQSTRHRRGSEPTTPSYTSLNSTQEMTVTEETTIASTENTDTEVNTIPVQTTTVSQVTSTTTRIPSTSRVPIMLTTSSTQSISSSSQTSSTSQSPLTSTQRPPTSTVLPSPSTTTLLSVAVSKKVPRISPTSGPGQVEVAVEIQEAGSKVAIKRTLSSKPIPPSLHGNSPFIEPVKNHTEEPVPLESHEALGEAEVPSSVIPGTHPEMEEYKKNVQDSGEDHTETDANTTDIPENTSSDDHTTLTSAEQGDQPLSDEPDLPERPNRGRLLTHPQHHSFYAYFLNRVLG